MGQGRGAEASLVWTDIMAATSSGAAVCTGTGPGVNNCHEVAGGRGWRKLAQAGTACFPPGGSRRPGAAPSRRTAPPRPRPAAPGRQRSPCSRAHTSSVVIRLAGHHLSSLLAAQDEVRRQPARCSTARWQHCCWRDWAVPLARAGTGSQVPTLARLTPHSPRPRPGVQSLPPSPGAAPPHKHDQRGAHTGVGPRLAGHRPGPQTWQLASQASTAPAMAAPWR